jgi:hypothetical protein
MSINAKPAKRRWPQIRPSEYQEAFRAMPICELQEYVKCKKAGWKVATTILTEREELAKRFQAMPLSQLEHWVLANKPDWQIARETLEERRGTGEHVGDKIPYGALMPGDHGYLVVRYRYDSGGISSLPSVKGRDGDWWRIQGE